MKCIQALCASLGLFVVQGFAAPTADEIISRLKARSEEATAAKNQFAYERVSQVDYLNDQGEVRKKATRVYDVTPVNGQPVSKLVLINGHAPTGKEESNRSAARETGDKTRELALGDDLLTRYQYTLRGEDTIDSRKAWVLDFSPKTDLKEDGFVDRLLNAMHGTIWVDQQEFDLARVDVHLGKKISFFGGLAGAIEKMDLVLIQKRIEPDAWLTENLTLDFAGRKLFSPMRFRCFENCSRFRKVAPLAER